MAGVIDQSGALCGASESVAQLREHGTTETLPLITRGELVGLLTLALISSEDFTNDAGLVLGEVAARLALTIEDVSLLKSVRDWGSTSTLCAACYRTIKWRARSQNSTQP